MFYFIENNFREYLKRRYRPLYCIWYGQRKDTWKKTRFAINFVAGFLIAWIICKLVLISFSFSEDNEKRVTWLSVVIIGVGFVFTDAIKCITLLVFVALVGKSGRSYLRALCFAYVIAGPIENLASNVGEVVRVFACSTILTYNLTRTRFDLMTKPFQRTVRHMKDDIREVQNTFSDLSNVTKVVHQEIMGDDPVTTMSPLLPITTGNINQTTSTTQFSKLKFTTSAPISIGIENDSSGKNFTAIDTAFHTSSESINDSVLIPYTTSDPIQFTLVPLPANESDPYSNITSILAGLHSTAKPINASTHTTYSNPIESPNLHSSTEPIKISESHANTTSKPIPYSSTTEPNKLKLSSANFDVRPAHITTSTLSASHLPSGRVLKTDQFSLDPKEDNYVRYFLKSIKNRIGSFYRTSTTLKPTRFSKVFKEHNHAHVSLRPDTFSSAIEKSKIETATDNVCNVNKDNKDNDDSNLTQLQSFLRPDNTKIKSSFTTFKAIKSVDDLDPFLNPTQFPFFLLKDKPLNKGTNAPILNAQTTAKPTKISSIQKGDNDRNQLAAFNQFSSFPIKYKLAKEEADVQDTHADSISKPINFYTIPRSSDDVNFFINPTQSPSFYTKDKLRNKIENFPIFNFDTTSKQNTFQAISKKSDNLSPFATVKQFPSILRNDDEANKVTVSYLSALPSLKDGDLEEFLNPTQFPLFLKEEEIGEKLKAASVLNALKSKPFFSKSKDEKDEENRESFFNLNEYVPPFTTAGNRLKHFVKRDISSDAEYSQEDDNFEDFLNPTEIPFLLIKDKAEEGSEFVPTAGVESDSKFENISSVSQDGNDFESFFNRTKFSISKDFVRQDVLPNAEYTQERYKNKMKKRCVQQLDNGKNRCRQAFANSLEKCRDKMPIILKTLLCWPFRVDFMCNINFLGNPDTICDPSDAIPDNFGETYADLADTENKLYKDGSNVSVSYKIMSLESSPELQSAKETADSVVKEFNLKKRLFDAILRQLQRFLAFMILRVLWACVQYHNKYKNEIEFDNIYVTEYFKHVDDRRAKLGKNPLLPLKKVSKFLNIHLRFERKNLVDTTEGWGRTKEESRDIIYHLFQFFVEMFAGFFFLLLDHVIVVLLQIVREHSEIHFVQEGEHTIKFYIEGSGLIARLLRTTMHNFNMHETVHTELSNKQCLPNPSVLPNSTTFLRLRRAICSYFYRKREKGRILYLYNTLRKQRRILIKTMIKKAKLNFVNRRVRQQANLFLRLRFMYPKYFGWLKKFKFGRHANVVICGNSQCGVCYCHECWTDMERECLVCDGLISQDKL
uniref:Uncharacterized protein n=1 Tax=Glossina brevipalpis TaxID=37001 RepID=A0A1A9W580_9MUSC